MVNYADSVGKITKQADVIIGGTQIKGARVMPKANKALVGTTPLQDMGIGVYFKPYGGCFLVDVRDDKEGDVANAKIRECPPNASGTYDYPSEQVSSKAADYEMQVALLKCDGVEAKRQQSNLNIHGAEAHWPKLPPKLCTGPNHLSPCADGRRQARPSKRTDGVPMSSEKGMVIDGDLIVAGKKVKGVSGEVAMMHLRNAKSRLGWLGGVKSHAGPEMLRVFREGVRQLKVAHQKAGPNEKEVVRIHTDGEKGLAKADVADYIRDQGWQHTVTDPHAHNQNARIESSNDKVQSLARAALLAATGASIQSEELWPEASKFARETANFQPEAGQLSPWEQAGNAKVEPSE